MHQAVKHYIYSYTPGKYSTPNTDIATVSLNEDICHLKLSRKFELNIRSEIRQNATPNKKPNRSINVILNCLTFDRLRGRAMI